MHTTAPLWLTSLTRSEARPRSADKLAYRGPTAPLRIVVLDGTPTTEVFDVAAAPHEIAIAEQHEWAAAFAELPPRVVGIFERRAADQCLADKAPLPSWVQRDIVEWTDAGFTPSLYRDLVSALRELEQHPSHPSRDTDPAAHHRLRASHWAEWARLVADDADPVIEAQVVLDGLRPVASRRPAAS
ncbi:hypothetical protein [Paramicrobacterium chengjingii]|uniref:hypothetical protein n=1 Tax=Paramicrobacterium chengjingii TaxID=2769067 RepID=UPI0014207F89|nr:hypothetical protein [Microbacterium chengjingii]